MDGHTRRPRRAPTAEGPGVMNPTTDDVAGLVAELRDRAKTRNTGRYVSTDDYCTMGYYSAGTSAFDMKIAALLESQAKALRDAENEIVMLGEVSAELLAAIPLEQATLKDWQDSSEAYRKDCESAEARALAAEARLKEAEKYLRTLVLPVIYDADLDAARAFINATPAAQGE